MRISERFRNKALNNTGFDTSVGASSSRILNKDGSSNVEKVGISRFERNSMYHTLINMSTKHFILFSLLAYLICNIFFATIYFFIGIEQLGVVNANSSIAQNYLDCFFFSTQTLTTVGYGVLHPMSNATNIISSIETLFGWMAFAVLTGLLYGRFSRPTAYIKFSDNLLISPFKESKALMFRLAPFKNNTLTDAAVKLNVAIKMEENGKQLNRYFTLEPDMNKINSLALSWTIVHELNESSPLYGMTMEDFKNNEIEVLVFVEAYDEHFSNLVKTKTSYSFDDIVDNAKFIPMFRQSPDKQKTLLEINRINEYKILD